MLAQKYEKKVECRVFPRGEMAKNGVSYEIEVVYFDVLRASGACERVVAGGADGRDVRE